jgi:transposase
MIPKAREVRLKPKVRKVLEARCRAPTTAQRDVRRARIVLLAAEGCSTRSIAEEVGVQPRIVSNWRRRFAEHGLGGLKHRPRAGKQPIHGKATKKRMDKPPPQGYGRWTGPLLAKALGDVDVQYVWRFLREHNIDLAARKSWCESNDPEFAAKAADVVGLYIDPPAKASTCFHPTCLGCALSQNPCNVFGNGNGDDGDCDGNSYLFDDGHAESGSMASTPGRPDWKAKPQERQRRINEVTSSSESWQPCALPMRRRSGRAGISALHVSIAHHERGPMA